MLILKKKIRLTKNGNLNLSLGQNLANQWVLVHVQATSESKSSNLKLSEFASKWKDSIQMRSLDKDSKLYYLLNKHG